MDVYSIVRKVPKGKVTTYKLIAEKLGIHPRAVAAALRKNFNKNVPCHRVVYSNGGVGGYNRGVRNKIKLLRSEGIKIRNGKIIDFERILFKP
ncbi:MAG: MGMT family protein [Nanoarchaeota archaeon]|nr:MGMT family protein [Nanoarchaeota archaeon]